MPQPGQCWRHVIIGTHGSWLPGSPKGWRSRGHRIHSSGDYKQPPPAGEHAGLYRYNKARCPDAVVIATELRSVVGQAFQDTLEAQSHRVLAIAACGTHCHCLAELPIDKGQTQRVIGDAKRRSSRAIKRRCRAGCGRRAGSS